MPSAAPVPAPVPRGCQPYLFSRTGESKLLASGSGRGHATWATEQGNGDASVGTTTPRRAPGRPQGPPRCPGTHPRAGTYLPVVRRARGLVPCQQHVLQRDQVVFLAVHGGHPSPRRARRAPPKAPACLLWHRPGCGALPTVGLTPQGPRSRLRQQRDMPRTVRCRLARWGAPAGRIPPVGMGLSRARRLPPSAHPFPGARGLLGAPGGCGDSTGVTTDPLGGTGKAVGTTQG